MSEPGLITNQIVSSLVDNELVIADLTDSNPNVFYEVAIRQAARMPLIMLIKTGQRIPFDLVGMRTIPYDHNDLDSVESAKEELRKQSELELAKDRSEIESPITIASELHGLKASSRLESQYLAQLVQDVSALSHAVSEVDRKIGANTIRAGFGQIIQSTLRGDVLSTLDRVIAYASHDSLMPGSRKDKEELLQEVIGELSSLRNKVGNKSVGG